MSLRSVLPIVIMLLLIPGPFDLRAAPSGSNGMTVKWTRALDENVTSVNWLDGNHELEVNSWRSVGGTCNNLIKRYNSTTGDLLDHWNMSCNTSLKLDNIDGDGYDELVSESTTNATVSLYDENLTVPYATHSWTGYHQVAYLFAEPGDLNHDGYNDLVFYVCDMDYIPGQNIWKNKTIEARSGKDLSVLWSYDIEPLSDFKWGTVEMWYTSTFDGNSDGVMDLMVWVSRRPDGLDETGYLMDGKTGEPLWNTSTDQLMRSTWLSDVNGDGKKEYVIEWEYMYGPGPYSLRFEIRALNGTLIPHPVLGTGKVVLDGDIQDVDNDNDLEYFSISRIRHSTLNYTIRDFWNWTVIATANLNDTYAQSELMRATHDYNGDGVPEILIISDPDYILDGRTKAVIKMEPYDREDHAWAPPFIGYYHFASPLDTRFPEVRVGLNISRYETGEVIWTGPQNGTYVYADLQDIDNDNDVEFLLVVLDPVDNGSVTSNITMYDIPNSLAAPPTSNPTNKKTDTSLETDRLLLILLCVLLITIAIIMIRHQTSDRKV